MDTQAADVRLLKATQGPNFCFDELAVKRLPRFHTVIKYDTLLYDARSTCQSDVSGPRSALFGKEECLLRWRIWRKGSK